MNWLATSPPVERALRRSSAAASTSLSLAVTAMAAILMACGDSEGSGGSPPTTYTDDEVRALHDDYCAWNCDCNGDCMCDYDDDELGADIDWGCGDPAAAFFACVLDHTCGESVKKECRDQEDALAECRNEGG